MANMSCSTCRASLKTVNARKKDIGVPLLYCESCGKCTVLDAPIEFGTLPRGKQSRYFLNFGIFLLSVLLPAAISIALYFLLPRFFELLKFYHIFFSALPLLLIPVLINVIPFARRYKKKAQIEASLRRCSYREYLMFLNDYAVPVSPYAMQGANKILDADTYLRLYAPIAKDERFLSRLSEELRAAVAEKTGKQLIEEIKQEVQDKTVNCPVEPPVSVSDVSSIERYIDAILKKYNLKCTEGRFQNIKIDLITYLESEPEPELDRLKKIVFDSLKV